MSDTRKASIGYVAIVIIYFVFGAGYIAVPMQYVIMTAIFGAAIGIWTVISIPKRTWFSLLMIIGALLVIFVIQMFLIAWPLRALKSSDKLARPIIWLASVPFFIQLTSAVIFFFIGKAIYAVVDDSRKIRSTNNI
jgi:hypothetical protein